MELKFLSEVILFSLFITAVWAMLTTKDTRVPVRVKTKNPKYTRKHGDV